MKAEETGLAGYVLLFNSFHTVNDEGQGSGEATRVGLRRITPCWFTTAMDNVSLMLASLHASDFGVAWKGSICGKGQARGKGLTNCCSKEAAWSRTDGWPVSRSQRQPRCSEAARADRLRVSCLTSRARTCTCPSFIPIGGAQSFPSQSVLQNSQSPVRLILEFIRLVFARLRNILNVILISTPLPDSPLGQATDSRMNNRSTCSGRHTLRVHLVNTGLWANIHVLPWLPTLYVSQTDGNAFLKCFKTHLLN